MSQCPNSLYVCIRFSHMVSSFLVHWHAARLFWCFPLKRCDDKMPKWRLRSRNYFQTASTNLSVRQCMLAACFTVCGREKYSEHSPPLLFFPANGTQELQKVDGLLIPEPLWNLTRHGRAGSDAAQVISSYRKADKLPEICFFSLASQNNISKLIFN